MTVPTLLVGGTLAVVALVACSAFFSSTETAIFSLSDAWIEEQVAAGRSGAADLEELRSDPHRLLVTILVGNNVVNVAIASITTVLVVAYLPPGVAVTIATLVASVVILVLGEIVPKSYGLGNADDWAIRVAGPIRLFERAVAPVVTVFDALTRRLTAALGGVPAIERAYLDE